MFQNFLKLLDLLVLVEREYDGFFIIPIIQGDNAGSHREAKFIIFVTEYCESKRGHWETQALGTSSTPDAPSVSLSKHVMTAL
jgi:hypothetical protein